jgi:hypothetical protein
VFGFFSGVLERERESGGGNKVNINTMVRQRLSGILKSLLKIGIP